ncbi:lycopene cyclase [Panacibacter ginsenosidivorans]|uniref:Lycopene cyclase n=1 Tax=Panacibacter ginsenosidivorans TaxID=1813871 RepID=A0A5B8V9J7_9BACT|nr:lycopene cyclase family protein [Panacibacter ginsenosidivorans]QEC68002.1 lycopene cyclase [Panacibacter ginsenosidivorans]
MASPVASHACTVYHYATILLIIYSSSLLSTQYDYIITGSGCAGLSLLHRMMQHSFFHDKQILVVDQSSKKTNDRTWCFWETNAGAFEEIIHHRWKQIDFFSDHFSARFDIAPYEYKMIRGIDFYNYVLDKAKQQSNIHFLYGDVQSLSNDAGKGKVTIEGRQYLANYIFNSIIFNTTIKVPPLGGGVSFYYFLQHFKGWLIKTPTNIFDERIATFMDFRISQQRGTSFVYVLPVAPNKALIEYTLFTEKVLEQYQYDDALEDYLKNYLKVFDYIIEEEEFGVIPMTNFPFSKGEGSIVNLGTAGGQTKASSGFTFRFIQKHTDVIIKALIQKKDPHIDTAFIQKRFAVYDNTLLNILHHKKLSGDKIFADLFKKNPPQRVLRFLDNETNLSEELKLMSTVPTAVFLPAAVRELFR